MSAFTPFVEQTAARLAPDRAERWADFFDTYSADIPERMPDAEYSKVALDAWMQFRKQDETTQIEALQRAWGIKHYAKVKSLPRRRRVELPPAVVVPQTKWEKCQHWGGTRPCSEHDHAMSSSSLARAQDMWTRFRFFVTKYLGAVLLGYTGGKWYDKFEDVQSQIWWRVALHVEAYRPLLNEKGEDCPQGWLRSIVRSVVSDHFKGEHRQKCDVRKEVQFFDNAANRGISNPDDPPPAHSTPTANALNGIRDENDGD